MKLRIGWIVTIWTTIVSLSVLVIISDSIGMFGIWSEAMLFFIPSAIAFMAGIFNLQTFSKKNPEYKTWKLFTIGAGFLLIAEALRTVLHLLPMLEINTPFLAYLPYPFILVCFIFLVWGFWYQQGIIETEIGKNLRILLAIILIAFTGVLLFVVAFPAILASTSIVVKIFTLLFLVGDLFMFTGALAISIRMWGGTLSKPWILWSIGTVILVGYHMYFTALMIRGSNPIDFGAGILLAIGLGFLATSAEWRRSLLE
jgi:hypothetical protein